MTHRHYVGGFDPGYGGGKLALIGPQGHLKTGHVPAVVGMGTTDLGDLSLGDVGRQRRRHLPDAVVFDGVTYLVGDGVERYAEPMEGMDFLRLRDGVELRALFYDVVYRTLGPGHHKLSLTVGLPVEVLLDRAQADATHRALTRWMVGRHRYGVRDEELTLEVEDVKTMAQPVGTLFAWGMDDRGRWTRSADDLHAAVGVLDIGFNTLDLFAIQGAEIARRYTDGDTLGMQRAANHLIRVVQDAHGKRLSLHQADALIRDHAPTLITSQGRIDLRPLVEQALGRAASGILSFVQHSDQWGDGMQFDHLLITGGGAEALREQLRDAFPQSYVMPDPVVANATGLARYARRAFK